MGKVTDSILLTIKKMLGIAEEYVAFDIDLIADINSVFLTLNQLGVGPEIPYRIEGAEETWNDFLKSQHEKLPGVETYVYLKTRLLFDPPTNSFLVDAMRKQCDELEWRLNLQMEGGKKNGNVLEGDSNKNELLGGSVGTGIQRPVAPTDRSREIELLKASWNKRNEVGS